MSTANPPRGMNIPNPADDDRAGPQRAELDAASHVGDLAVRERVADVRGDRAGHRERDPVPVRVPETRGDRHVPRRPGDEDRRDERERGGEDHEHHDVVRLVLAVVGEQHLEGAATPQAQSGLFGHCLLRSHYTHEECASVVGARSGRSRGRAGGDLCPLRASRNPVRRPAPLCRPPGAGRMAHVGQSSMRPGGFEPPTNGLEVRRSVH